MDTISEEKLDNLRDIANRLRILSIKGTDAANQG